MQPIPVRLGLTAAAPEELICLPAPSLETLRLCEDRWEGLERRLASLAEEVRKTEVELAETDRRMEETRLAQEVPTEADLAVVRDARDWGGA